MLTPRGLGRLGESVASRLLGQKSYHVIARNWTCDRGEVDLVALDGSSLVFVEVKTRRGAGSLAPEMAVDLEKQRRLRRVGREFLASHPLLPHDRIRFDVVAVSMTRRGRIADVRHFTDAFSPEATAGSE